MGLVIGEVGCRDLCICRANVRDINCLAALLLPALAWGKHGDAADYRDHERGHERDRPRRATTSGGRDGCHGCHRLWRGRGGRLRGKRARAARCWVVRMPVPSRRRLWRRGLPHALRLALRSWDPHPIDVEVEFITEYGAGLEVRGL